MWLLEVGESCGRVRSRSVGNGWERSGDMCGVDEVCVFVGVEGLVVGVGGG